MATDQIFRNENRRILDFTFGKETAEVFPDMLERSVPFYSEVQRMIQELAADFGVDDTNVYDLGCSTGTTLHNLDSMPQSVHLVGIDDSPDMIARAESNLAGCEMRHGYTLLTRDLGKELRLDNASVIVMSLTLQFIRPLYRARMLSDICRGCNPNGCLILFEKVLCEDTLLNRLYVEHYYALKQRNGYSGMEISRKREALENVLIPYRVQENQEMLHEAGFRNVDIFFKWYNFAGFLAIK